VTILSFFFLLVLQTLLCEQQHQQYSLVAEALSITTNKLLQRRRRHSCHVNNRNPQRIHGDSVACYAAAAAASSSSSDEDYYNSDNKDSDNSSDSSRGSRDAAFLRNEFSRTINTNRIFARRISSQQYSQQQAQQQQQRDYEMTIQASTQECQALAARFDLTDLSELQAQLSVRPAMSAVRADQVLPVEVEGTMAATVTQTCVRTGERFQVQVELPLYCLVKPMLMMMTMNSNRGGGEDIYWNDDDDEVTTPKQNNNNNNNNKKKSKNNKKKNKTRHSLEDHVFDLQAAIQSAAAVSSSSSSSNDSSSSDGNTMDLSMTATLVEDEAIYSSQTGMLDVGELVAQTFWLQLDPFPKKPGSNNNNNSGPMEMEITG
jgi:hypothetical protein